MLAILRNSLIIIWQLPLPYKNLFYPYNINLCTMIMLSYEFFKQQSCQRNISKTIIDSSSVSLSGPIPPIEVIGQDMMLRIALTYDYAKWCIRQWYSAIHHIGRPWETQIDYLGVNPAPTIYHSSPTLYRFLKSSGNLVWKLGDVLTKTWRCFD